MRKLLVGICVLTIAALACNINVPLGSSNNHQQSAIETVVAQTMQAVLSASSASSTPMTVLNTPALMTPSPSATPLAVIKASTSCRSGPAETYNSVTDLTLNQSVPVLGKDPSGQYWLIQISSGTCWVAAQNVSITGNTQAIPEVTPALTASDGAPAAPTSLFYSYSCTSLTEATITLTWTDVANNETGYRVYRNGSVIAELPANSTTFTDNTSRVQGSVFSYSVEAFNSVGVSDQRTTGDFRLSGCQNP